MSVKSSEPQLPHVTGRRAWFQLKHLCMTVTAKQARETKQGECIAAHDSIVKQYDNGDSR